MSLKLDGNRITTISDCTDGRDLLAWVDYPATTRQCFAYPQYAYEGYTLRPIDESVFPELGAISIATGGSVDSRGLEKEFGSLVIVRINTDNLANAYYGNGNDRNKYHSVINRDIKHSYIEFARLSEHKLSSELVQVISVRESPGFSSQVGALHVLDGIALPQTRQILIEDGGSYIGPFDYSCVADDSDARGTLKLTAPADNDQRVFSFTSKDMKRTVDIRDKANGKGALFVKADDVQKAVATADQKSTIYDWLSDNELLDVLGRALANTGDADFTKNKIRRVKSSIGSLTSEVAGIKLDARRLQRLQSLIATYESWATLPEQLSGKLFESISDDRLARIALSEQYYPEFSRRVLGDENVNQRLDQDRAKYGAELDELRGQVAKENARLEKTKAEVASLESHKETVRKEALESGAEELKRLEQEIAQRGNEIQELDRQIEERNRSYYRLKDKIEEVIREFRNESDVTGKLLESEMVRQVVNALAGIDAAVPVRGTSSVQASPVSSAPEVVLRPDEVDLSEARIVDLLYEDISEKSGRDYTRNDVINFLTCVTQGYITTFAGLPGTGKTSLCNIIAGALGLKGQFQRFSEVNVERGWTSYKDYIGYWNPLSNTCEKANADIYNAFERLDNESQDVQKRAPYIFLLDEANMSPIEHYWAPFLRACDGFQADGATLALGGDVRLHVPPYVRFLATVNYDHTTETLSPRFLSRSWVIRLDLDQPSFDVDADLVPDDAGNEDLPFSYERLQTVFGVGSGQPMDSAMRDVFSSFVRTCGENAFGISPRVQRMVTNYVNAAGRLMETSSKDFRYAPLDYAIAEKILPSINGPAETYEKLLKDLQSNFSQLTLTQKIISRMLTTGEDSGYYQFFE